MSKIGKELDQLQPLQRNWEKKTANFGPQTKKVAGARIDKPYVRV